MCLEITAIIGANAPARISAARLSAISGLIVSSRKFEGESRLHFSVSGGCSCEFLADDATFNAESWALAPPHLPALAAAIAALHRECKQFSFVAHWLGGERERRTQEVSGEALGELVARNEVGNNVRYVVV
jgi:hypothetical protein